jgi:hypothetical protein
MPPKIENSANVPLAPASEDLLQRIFARYKKVILEKEFSKGLSGGRVFAVRPIRGDGAPELPTVVKLAPVSLIQQEWQAYQQHVLNRLPRISQVSARPILLREAGLGGLRYTMGGDGTFEVMSLHDYCRSPETSVDQISAALHHLFRIMHNIWSFQSMCQDFHLRASYDMVLPVNLLVQPGVMAGQPAHLISPTRFPSALPQPGETVRLDGFVVHKVNYDTQTMTLKSPHVSPAQPAYFMRCKLPLPEGPGDWEANAAIGAIDGRIVETRESKLKAEVLRAFDSQMDPGASLVHLAAAVQLPNPLLALPSLIERRRQAKLATIHGDFNLENILIEPETGAISLIDFADAREDHVLHDLLRLETEIITRLLPELIATYGLLLAPTLVQLIWRMHLYTLQKTSIQGGAPHLALQKLWAMLEMIRRTVRSYFCDVNDISEYYEGLIFYLLGALKFRNLNDAPEAPLPKQAAFYAATVVHYLLLNPTTDPVRPPQLLRPLLERTPASNAPPDAAHSIGQTPLLCIDPSHF